MSERGFKPDCGEGPNADDRAAMRAGARAILAKTMDQIGPCQRCRAELLIQFVEAVSDALVAEGEASVALFDERRRANEARSANAKAIAAELLKDGAR